MREKHWIGTDGTEIGNDPLGFWVCPKIYNKFGKRIKTGSSTRLMLPTDCDGFKMGEVVIISGLVRPSRFYNAWKQEPALNAVLKVGVEDKMPFLTTEEFNELCSNGITNKDCDNGITFQEGKAVGQTAGMEELIIVGKGSQGYPAKVPGHPISGSHVDTSDWVTAADEWKRQHGDTEQTMGEGVPAFISEFLRQKI